jgi:hypothetical protein
MSKNSMAPRQPNWAVITIFCSASDPFPDRKLREGPHPRTSPKVSLSNATFEELTQPTELYYVVKNTVFCRPEKAGVGGSIPSLATILQQTYRRASE